MAGVNGDFRFLTMEEFSRLSQKEKISYLEKAAGMLKKPAGSRRGLFSRATRRDRAGNRPPSEVMGTGP